jgi:DNA-binding NarL/FixJ family response regulator
MVQTSEGLKPRAVRVLLADDHPMVRRGLRTLITMQPEFEVCAEATTGREALEKAQVAKPEVALLDLSMPEMNGLEATRAVRKMLPGTEVLILTHYESEELMTEALRAGAYGYMLKSDAGTDLITALECLSQHRPFFTSKVWKLILRGYLKDTNQSAGSRRALRGRDLRIVGLLADGKSNKEVAAAERMSVKTVERSRAKIMKKLNLSSLCDIVRYAVRNEIGQA